MRYRSLSTSHVYAMGEGWTGALGNQDLTSKINGHDDFEAPHVPQLVYKSSNSPSSTNKNRSNIQLETGWAHTVLLDSNETDQLYITGRPFEVHSLLRLQRMPQWFRHFCSRESFRTTHTNMKHLSVTNPVNWVSHIVGTAANLFHDTTTNKTWDKASQYSFAHSFTALQCPEPVQSVACSAGLTALVAHDSGNLYCFGLNGFGQCGMGETSNNIWEPTAVVGLTSEFCADSREAVTQPTHPITTVQLGFQHGLALNNQGEVFSWGKGNRGQLGHHHVEYDRASAAPLKRGVADLSSKPHPLPPISKIESGMMHSVALDTASNALYHWGKFVLPARKDDKGQPASDAKVPTVVSGLPDQLRILDMSCGSHHTSILLEDGSVWCLGISGDSKQPIHEPVCVVEPGQVEMPLTFFRAHMDRTTVIDASGTVHQFHLWHDPEHQRVAVFTPAWVDKLLEHDSDLKITQVHRGWLHTMVVAEKE